MLLCFNILYGGNMLEPSKKVIGSYRGAMGPTMFSSLNVMMSGALFNFNIYHDPLGYHWGTVTKGIYFANGKAMPLSGSATAIPFDVSAIENSTNIVTKGTRTYTNIVTTNESLNGVTNVSSYVTRTANALTNMHIYASSNAAYTYTNNIIQSTTWSAAWVTNYLFSDTYSTNWTTQMVQSGTYYQTNAWYTDQVESTRIALSGNSGSGAEAQQIQLYLGPITDIKPDVSMKAEVKATLAYGKRPGNLMDEEIHYSTSSGRLDYLYILSVEGADGKSKTVTYMGTATNVVMEVRKISGDVGVGRSRTKVYR